MASPRRHVKYGHRAFARRPRASAFANQMRSTFGRRSAARSGRHSPDLLSLFVLQAPRQAPITRSFRFRCPLAAYSLQPITMSVNIWIRMHLYLQAVREGDNAISDMRVVTLLKVAELFLCKTNREEGVSPMTVTTRHFRGCGSIRRGSSFLARCSRSPDPVTTAV